MKITTMHAGIVRSPTPVSLLVALLLASCTEVTATPVNVLGVNYAEKEFTYRLEDPGNPKNTAGGEMIDSFSAGGVHCCYELPKRWRPGIKVRLLTTEWQELKPPQNSQTIKETRNTVEVEVPNYVDGKPGDLWIVRSADGSFGLVSSSYQPDHPKWPGKVKGWPVPSVEYRRTLWDQQIKFEASYVELYQSSLAQLKANPVAIANEEWAYRSKDLSRYDPAKNYDNPTWQYMKANYELLRRFSGPDDPGFIAWLKGHYEQSLAISQADLKRVQDSKP